jgi:hypothetical protein
VLEWRNNGLVSAPFSARDKAGTNIVSSLEADCASSLNRWCEREREEILRLKKVFNAILTAKTRGEVDSGEN